MVPGENVLFIVLTNSKEPYLSIRKYGQEKTWVKDIIHKNLEIVYVSGNQFGKIGEVFDNLREHIRLKHGYLSKILGLIENILLYPFFNFIPNFKLIPVRDAKIVDLKVNFPDFYLTLRWKLLVIFDYFVRDTQKDFILITTTSSFISVEVLLKELEIMPKNNLYSGSFTWPGAKFISGSNRLISRDVAIKILQNQKLWRIDTIEDVELGRILNNLGIKPTGKSLLSISSLQEVKLLSSEILNSNYHFRLKSGTKYERLDVELMHALYSRIKINE